ncbi:stalk domain-containing protein [Paenibacillus sp. GCM10023250]|uniref:stalk domain-containing protein n=1 Tax=Paenibacillus sp. GCM10023250 TaxID=3252648 RepID=UPI00361975B5
MSMKKTILISALAAAISTSAIGVASAATTQVTAPASFSVTVNDASIMIRSIQVNGATLVSLRDLGTAAGARFIVNVKAGVTAYVQGRAVELHAGSKTATVDGQPVELEQAVVNVNGSYYISVEDFVNLFSVDAEQDDSGQFHIDAVQKIHADSIVWINASQLLASSLTEEGRTDYIVDAATGAFKQVLSSDTASELTVSPDGTKAAYTNEDGSVYVIDLTSATFASKQVSADSNIKPELVWSADGSAIYFLQGDKGSVIQKLNVADGTITKVLDDKVDYKADLSVSKDGTKFYYTVTKPGAVTAPDKPVDEDDVAIDTTGTEPQVYFFDASVKDAAPVKLTTSTDDKIFVGAAEDGYKAFYISIADGQPSSLVSVAKDKTVAKVIGDKDVLAATIAGGNIYALTDAGERTALSSVDAASGTVKAIGNLEGNVTEVAAAPNGSVAVIVDDQTFTVQGGSLKRITK